MRGIARASIRSPTPAVAAVTLTARRMPAAARMPGAATVAAATAGAEETVVAVAATRFRHCALALFCGLGGILLAAAAQDPQKPTQTPVPEPQRPIFRAGVDVVRIDVIPRRRNRIVEGLTVED